MSVIEKSVEVAVPVRVAYDQWTQFEDFPHFMEGVERVEQIDDTTLRWHVSIGGVDRSFIAEITEQEPDRRVAWRSIEGETHAGVVTFTSLDDELTHIDVEMTYDPEGWVERTADALNILDRRVEKDLERLRSFLEERGAETGAWRGAVRDGEVAATDPSVGRRGPGDDTQQEQPLTGGLPGGAEPGPTDIGDDPLPPGGGGTHR